MKHIKLEYDEAIGNIQMALVERIMKEVDGMIYAVVRNDVYFGVFNEIVNRTYNQSKNSNHFT